MKRLVLALTMLAGMFALTPIANADSTPCNCSVVVGSCFANLNAKGKQLNWTSDTRQCSKIQGSINGEPYTTTFKGGSSSQEWRGKLPLKNLEVNSCQICQDGSKTSAPQQSLPQQNNKNQQNTEDDLAGTWTMRPFASQFFTGKITGTATIKKMSEGQYALTGSQHNGETKNIASISANVTMIGATLTFNWSNNCEKSCIKYTDNGTFSGNTFTIQKPSGPQTWDRDNKIQQDNKNIVASLPNQNTKQQKVQSVEDDGSLAGNWSIGEFNFYENNDSLKGEYFEFKESAIIIRKASNGKYVATARFDGYRSKMDVYPNQISSQIHTNYSANVTKTGPNLIFEWENCDFCSTVYGKATVSNNTITFQSYHSPKWRRN